MNVDAKLRTCLSFDERAEEAVAFYVSLLPDSRVEKIVRPGAGGPVLVIEFTLAGAPFMTLNMGERREFGRAVSISVLTEDQAETDRLWTALIAEGGEPGRCGWLKDRWSLHWQIVPKALPRLLESPDPEAGARVQAALMSMGRIDVAALEAAFAEQEEKDR